MAATYAVPPRRLYIRFETDENTRRENQQRWKFFLEAWTTYCKLSDIKVQTPEFQLATFFKSVGNEGVRLYNKLTFDAPGDRNDVDKVVGKFHQYFEQGLDVLPLNSAQNGSLYNRYLFHARIQQPNESFESFVCAVKMLAGGCCFCHCARDDLVRDRILLGMSNSALRQRLLQEHDLSLEVLLEVCQMTSPGTSPSTASFSPKDVVSQDGAEPRPAPILPIPNNLTSDLGPLAFSSESTVAESSSGFDVLSHHVGFGHYRDVPEPLPSEYMYMANAEPSTTISEMQRVPLDAVSTVYAPVMSLHSLEPSGVAPSCSSAAVQSLVSQEGPLSASVGPPLPMFLPYPTPACDGNQQAFVAPLSSDRTSTTNSVGHPTTTSSVTEMSTVSEYQSSAEAGLNLPPAASSRDMSSDMQDDDDAETDVGEDDEEMSPAGSAKCMRENVEVTQESSSWPACEICGKRFRTMKKVNRHKFVHRQKYRCSTCLQELQGFQQYQRHQVLHTVALSRCSICQHQFLKPSALRKHMAAAHPETGTTESVEPGSAKGGTVDRGEWMAAATAASVSQPPDPWGPGTAGDNAVPSDTASPESSLVSESSKCHICHATFPDLQQVQMHLAAHAKPAVDAQVSQSGTTSAILPERRMVNADPVEHHRQTSAESVSRKRAGRKMESRRNLRSVSKTSHTTTRDRPQRQATRKHRLNPGKISGIESRTDDKNKDFVHKRTRWTRSQLSASEGIPDSKTTNVVRGKRSKSAVEERRGSDGDDLVEDRIKTDVEDDDDDVEGSDEYLDDSSSKQPNKQDLSKGRREYKCADCGKVYLESRNLRIHRAANCLGQEGNPHCRHCGKVYTSLKRLQNHVQLHHLDALTPESKDCDRRDTKEPLPSRKYSDFNRSATRRLDNAQSGSKDEGSEFPCKHCPKVFRNSWTRQYHTQQIHERLFNCSKCGNVSQGKDAHQAHLRTHVKTKVGEKSKMAICRECGKVCGSYYHLKKHMASVHFGETTPCDVCGKKFVDKNYLNYHKVIHTGEMPFWCSICNKGFKLVQGYKYHMRKHDGTSPYTCEYCGASFYQMSHLKYHIRAHTNERPHACMECGKRFLTSSSLKRHAFVHTEERNSICELCGRGYKCEKYLQVHMKTHEKEAKNAAL